MPEDDAPPHPTLALSTKVEEDFVAPLTAVRGSLEILRDFSDLGTDERLRFIETALGGCARLEKGIGELARTVYAAGRQTLSAPREEGVPPAGAGRFSGHVRFFDDLEVVEVDFAGVEFDSSKTVNEFFDVVENLVETTGRLWYFLVNYGGCSVWPEAWVAFAHRGKRMNVAFSRGTVRYDESAGDGAGRTGELDPSYLGTREAALDRIERMKSADSASRRPPDD